MPHKVEGHPRFIVDTAMFIEGVIASDACATGPSDGSHHDHKRHVSLGPSKRAMMADNRDGGLSGCADVVSF